MRKSDNTAQPVLNAMTLGGSEMAEPTPHDEDSRYPLIHWVSDDPRPVGPGKRRAACGVTVWKTHIAPFAEAVTCPACLQAQIAIDSLEI